MPDDDDNDEIIWWWWFWWFWWWRFGLIESHVIACGDDGKIMTMIALTNVIILAMRSPDWGPGKREGTWDRLESSEVRDQPEEKLFY